MDTAGITLDHIEEPQLPEPQTSASCAIAGNEQQASTIGEK